MVSCCYLVASKGILNNPNILINLFKPYLIKLISVRKYADFIFNLAI